MNLEVKLIDRGGKLYVEYYKHSKRCKKSLGLNYTTTNKNYAQKHIIPKILEDLINNREVQIFKKKDDSEMIYCYLEKVLEESKHKKSETQRVYNFFITLFKSFFDNKRVSDFSKDDLQKYLLYLQNTKKYKKASIRLAVAPINIAFDLAYEDDLLLKPLKLSIKMKDDKKNISALSKEQIKELLESADGKLKDYLHIAFYTGLRVSEIVALRWSDIDYEKKSITIQRIVKNGKEQLPKTGKIWQCPLNPNLEKYLDSIPKKSESIINLSVNTIYCKFKNLQRKLCYQTIYGTHIIRHTFITQNIMAGNIPNYIQLYTGHSSTKMINDIYTHYQATQKDMNRYNDLLQIGNS